MQKQLNHLNRGPIKQLHTVGLPLSREEAVILEAAHLNLHHIKTKMCMGMALEKTIHGSRTVYDFEANAVNLQSDVTGSAGSEEVLYSWALFLLSSVEKGSLF